MIHFASSHNQKKDNNKFKNKKITRTARKSNCMEVQQLKKHSCRLVGDTETGSQGGEDMQQGGGWRTRAGKVAAGRLGGLTFACR